MIWGSFGKIHIATLIVAILINVVLYLFLRKKSRRTQILILFTSSLIGTGTIIFDLIYWNSPWEHLPLHLGSLMAILLPYAVLSRKKWACNLLLLWSFGSYLALIFNADMADTKLLSWPFIFYYALHVLEAGVPVLLFALDLVDRDTKTIKISLSISLIVYTIVHFINLAINSANILGPTGEIIQVNYLYSVVPTNEFLNFFYLLIPSPYWYMFLTLPIIFLYVVWWYLPEMLDDRRRQKYLRMKLKAVDEYYDEYYDEYVDEIIEEKFDD